MPFMHYVAFQGIVDERMQRETDSLSDCGWQTRFILIHPQSGWIIQLLSGSHIVIPRRIVGQTILDELIFFPVYILMKYLPVFLRDRSRIRLLYVQNFPDIFSIPFLLLGKIFRIPSAFEIADPWKEFVFTETTEIARSRGRFALYYAVLSIIERLAIVLASGLIFSSESYKAKRSQGTRKPSLLLNNYSAYASNQGIKSRGDQLRRRLKMESNLVFSYIGGFQEYRGVDVLLESVASVLKQERGVILLLVGAHGDAMTRIHDRIRRLGIEENCLVAGWVPNEEVVDYYSASDVGVIPYKRTLATELTSPNKIFNYLSLGKPVIISELTELARYVEDGVCGLKVQPGDPTDLSKAILRLASDHQLMERMKRKAMAIGTEYRFKKLKPVFTRFIYQLARAC